MNIIKKLLDKLSLTRTEVKVFLFLGAVLLVGSGYKFFFKSEKSHASIDNDYSATDSLFNAAISDANETADYKEEVLELKNAQYESSIKELPAEHSININTAGIEDLSRLPGIGEKTAQIIIDFRTEHGRINKPEDLLEVKGIGESKLNRIIKYIVID